MSGSNTKLAFVIGGIFAFYFGTIIPLLIQWVSSSGRNLINVQGADEYLIALGWAIALTMVIFTFRVSWDMKRHLLMLWGVRCAVTLIAMLFYERSYNLDAHEYYKNIMRQSVLPSESWTNGTNFVINSGIFLDNYLPFGRSYHAFKVVWSFFGFLAIIPLYNVYKHLVNSEKENTTVLWVLGTFPSLLFWTSILGKDPLAGLGIACLAYGLLRLHKRPDAQGIIYAAIGLALLSFVRFWLVAIFLSPIVMSFAWGRSTHKIWRYVGLAACTTGLVYLFNNIQSLLLITTTNDALESLNVVSSAWARGGSALDAPSFSSTADVLRFLPLGFLTAIFRPLPGEVNNIFGIIAGLESFAIIIIFISALRNMKFEYLSNSVVIYCWVAILIWGSFYAFISYQNLGTAVRFRAQILPFIVLMPFIIKSIREKAAAEQTQSSPRRNSK